MTLILNIIAEPPKDVTAPGAGNQDGNAAITTLATMMEGARTSGKLDYEAAILRAAYVRELGLKLRDLGRTPDLIQIIGHGSAGRLELGSYWSGKPFDPQLGPAILDSNPESYGMLERVIAPSTKVLLLGCSVGAAAPSGYVASGRALLFDLEDMTGANVYAADDLVHPALFTDGFLYGGSLVTSSGKPANPAALAAGDDRRGPTAHHEQAPPAGLKLKSAPTLGFRRSLDLDPEAIARSLGAYVLAQPQPSQLLAMAEYVFSADNYARVEAICCLRYLRAQTHDGRTVYFERGADPARIVDGGFGKLAADKLRESHSAQ